MGGGVFGGPACRKSAQVFLPGDPDTSLPLPFLPSRISLGLSFFQLHNGPRINRITWTRRCKTRNKKVPLFIWYTQCEPSTGDVRPCH